MANYHKRNSIRAVQWAPENAQSFEDIKKLIAENPGIGWKADNIVRNDASDNIIIRSFGMIVLRIVRKPSPKSNSVTFLPEFFFKISIISFTASALHPNLKTLWSSWKTLSFPTTDRSLRWLQAVWKLWGFQSRRVISTRMTSPPSMFPSNLSAFITSF